LRPAGSRPRLLGSSPHARGARRCYLPVQGAVGLIPACAGSTGRTSAVREGPQAHPRMRGEHHLPPFSNAVTRGSSPHARGARAGGDAAHLVIGLIPACAGSTSVPWRVTRSRTAHPRMRGEHDFPLCPVPGVPGSSPHARGAPRQPRLYPQRCGLIPACAGSTLECVLLVHQVRAHPRMRGEHPNFFVDVSRPAGSSPHARGALHRRRVPRVDTGLIPACAGSTRMR